jgi:beta-mannosidase
MKNRQKSYVGNDLIIQFIKKYFGEDATPEKIGISDWIAASQAVQAHAYQTAISAHRTKTPHCMGTMFWQLNDCWPGASWSIIDYEGNPKKAYDMVQKSYAPVLIRFGEDSGQQFVYAVQDGLEKRSLELILTAHPDKADKTVIWRENVTLKPLNVWSKTFDEKWANADKLQVEVHEGDSLIDRFDFYPKWQSSFAFE